VADDPLPVGLDLTVLQRAAAARTMAHSYKVWGFGEDIGLRGLLEHSAATGDATAGRFVADLVRPWCVARTELTNADHVAPGVVMLDLYQMTGDDVYLAAALRVAELHRWFPRVDGVAVHRPDLLELSSLVWVDCVALDAPFLVRLARVTGSDEWLELGIATLDAYLDVLRDSRRPLFCHGYDVAAGSRSPCLWGRGNGWALHGLVDTLAELPEAHPATKSLVATLRDQVTELVALQHPGGLWHTILDDGTAPLENSTAAFYASGVLKALRLGLLERDLCLDHMVDRAVTAMLAAVEPDGGLPISYATPIGSPATYRNAPTGVFPWGQGPLLLTLIELGRRNVGAGDTARASGTSGGVAP
jgi:unsaturated rhamnogalacturonyl hydrolase